MQSEGQGIDSSQRVCRVVKDTEDIEVNQKQVRHVLKHEFKLSFVKTKKLHPSANSARSLILRQQYALAML